MADRHRISALVAALVGLSAALTLTACTALVPARDPKPGELVGVWKHGATTLAIHDKHTFSVEKLSSEHVYSEEGRDIELNVSGAYAIDQDRLENLRALTFGYDPVGGSNSGGLIQAAFDPTTNPVSIVILGGSVDDPVYFRLYKKG